MENQEFKYYAFISYNHKDSREVKSLHRKIEGYRIPKAIRKGTIPELPKKIKPVFLDSDEADSGKSLNEVMLNNIRDSKSLIVVCSPNSAESKYVNFEVDTFKNINKDRKIIPYIIAGSPSPNNSEPNCYPPSLDKEITGASIQELGKQKAFVKVVAGIFDINFDKLWDRHKRRERQRKIIWASAVTIIIGLFIGVLMYARYIQYLKEATINYEKASKLIDDGKTNKGIAYLTKSLENINYEPSIKKLNSVLIQESYLVLDTITENKQPDFDPYNYWKFNKTLTFYSALETYGFFIKNGKFNTRRNKDSIIIGSIDLYYQGKILPSFRIMQDEKIMLLAEPIYKDKEIIQDKFDTFLSESNEFRLRVFHIESFSLIKDLRIKGALNEVEISPMGNHIVVVYRKENEIETTIEAIPLEKSYKKWERNILGNLQKLSFNPNGIYISARLSKDINASDEIKIYNIFNPYEDEHSIELSDKVKHYCYSKDGRRLAVLTNNNELYVYNIPECNLAFASRALAGSLNIVSIEFDASDEKLIAKTQKNIFSFLLQKSPFKLSKIRFTQGVTDKLCYNSSKDIIATSHCILGDKGFISFIGGNIKPLKFNHKINVYGFSPNGNYLVVGTGDLLNESSKGDIYVYAFEDSESNINNDSIRINKVYHSKLDCPISKIAFNSKEDRFVAYTVSGGRNTDVCCFSINKNKSIAYNKVSCNDNVDVAEFLNNDELAIGTTNNEVEFWNIKDLKKKNEVKTEYYPIDIELDNSKNIIVASTFNHSLGEINYFDKNGTSLWSSPIATTFGIQKLIVAGNKLIVISESNLMSVFDLKTKSQVINDIKILGVIKDALLINDNLKILSRYSKQFIFDLKETKQFSTKLGQQSIIQTYDIRTGEELGVPFITNDDITGLKVYKNDFLYYTSNYFFGDQLASTNLNLDTKTLIKIANAIAGYQFNNYGIAEPAIETLSSLTAKNPLKQWLCSSSEKRRLLPSDNTLLKNQLDLLCDLEYNQVLQSIDIYPSYLKAQGKFWFSEAIRIAEKNFLSNNDAKSINQHNYLTMSWSTYFSNNKANAVYSDPEAQLFADFYTQLMVRQHPNSIYALKERANFCSQTNRLNEYNNYMDKIESITLNDL